MSLRTSGGASKHMFGSLSLSSISYTGCFSVCGSTLLAVTAIKMFRVAKDGCSGYLLFKVMTSKGTTPIIDIFDY